MPEGMGGWGGHVPKMLIQAPDGRHLNVLLPAHAVPGTVIQVSVPAVSSDGQAPSPAPLPGTVPNPDAVGPPQPLHITVRTMAGNATDFRLEALSSDTIGVVKAIIKESNAVPIARQRLMFQGKQLGNRMTLETVGVPNGGMIYLTVLGLSDGQPTVLKDSYSQHLLESVLEQELQSLTVKELRQRAATEGVDEDAIEDARDGHSPKEDVRLPLPLLAHKSS
eukprot:COSAG04_NODE_886_length_9631_cov_8.594943_11_plen_222_part_00